MVNDHKEPVPEAARMPLSAAWWDRATEADQAAILRRLRLSLGLAAVPWAFLPKDIQEVLHRRVRIAGDGAVEPGR